MLSSTDRHVCSRPWAEPAPPPTSKQQAGSAQPQRAGGQDLTRGAGAKV